MDSPESSLAHAPPMATVPSTASTVCEERSPSPVPPASPVDEKKRRPDSADADAEADEKRLRGKKGDEDEDEDVERQLSGDVEGDLDLTAGEGAGVEARARRKAAESEIPNGGYGWLIVLAMALMNTVTWGLNGSFGVFLSFYLANDYFHGATSLEYAFIGGLSISLAMLMAPLAAEAGRRYGMRPPMVVGTALIVCGQIGAGFVDTIAELFICQGVLFGLGMGLCFVPAFPAVSMWFSSRRGAAMGIGAGGSGVGGLVLSISTRRAIAHLGLRWAFVINGCVVMAVMIPVIIIIKPPPYMRGRTPPAAGLPINVLWHPGWMWVWLWGTFSLLGYVIGLYSLASFASQALGLRQSQAALVQSMLSLGMLVGRPGVGFILDWGGRINMSVLMTFISGLTCLVWWEFATSLPALIVFAIVQGATGGVFWASSAPVSAEILPLAQLSGSLSVLWLSIVVPTTFAEPIAVVLLNYSTDHLHRTGIDLYRISIGFAGGCFILGSLMLLGAKRYVQGNWKILCKT